MASDTITYADVAVIGAGTAGLAAFRAARKTGAAAVLIGEPPFGTTCARVGCMPSKALLSAAKKAVAARKLSALSSGMPAPYIDSKAVMKDVRAKRDHFVSSVVDGLADFGDDEFIAGRATLLDAHRIEVTDHEGGKRGVTANKLVIATGSSPIILPGFEGKARVLTTDALFELESLPASLIIVGDGAIALECAFALSALNVDVTVLGHGGPIGGLTDGAIGDAAETALFDGIQYVPDQDNLALVDASERAVTIAFDRDGVRHHRKAEAILLAVGRDPNIADLGLDALDLERTEAGTLKIDPFTGETSAEHIVIAGDATGVDTVLHVASNEGQHAGNNVMRETPRACVAQPSLRIVFTEPGIAVVGSTRQALNDAGQAYVVGAVDFSEQGRAVAEDQNAGRLHIYACPKTGRVLGSEMVAPDAEHLAHLIAAAMTANWTVSQFLTMPFYHPTIEEGLRTALREAEHALRHADRPLDQSLDIAAGC